MKMVGGTVLHWLCSSSSPLALLIRNRNGNRILLCRAFSASTLAPELEESTRLTNINLETQQAKEDWASFKSWMSKYGKSYESEKELFYRFEVFCGALRSIEKFNKKNNGCTYGLNAFSDLTQKEMPRGRRVL